MEEVKKINRVLFIVALIKILGGLLCHSYSMIASCLLDLLLIVVSRVAMIKGEDSKGKRIITTLIGLIMILSAVIMVIFGIKYSIGKVSAWIILFALVTMLVKYMINCFYTNINYRKKNGLLSFGTLNSTLDFVAVAIFIVTMILSKLSKWIGVFKYADCVGTILISGYMVYKGVSIIINSVKAKSEDKINEIIEKCKNEITARKEIKKVERLALVNYGGINYYKCGIVLSEGISMIDANTFVVTLQDYLLKFADAVKIDLIDPNIKPKHVKVRSLKEDARNSRSRNGKTNSKKKNSTKKNKKR
jgi:divalent metal cation (Fe/Co/Zn/Cd) transporter